MALTPALVYADLAVARTSGGFAFPGLNFDRLAWAVSYAVTTWLKAGGTVLKGISIGTAGMGSINTPTTRLELVPNPSLVIDGLVSASMQGPLSVSLGTVVAYGLAKSVSMSGQYAGEVSGVGVGNDVSKVLTTNGPALIAQLEAFMSSMLGPGPASVQMSHGLGTGIASHFLAITGTGTVVGPPSLSAATGQSTSVVV